MAKPKLVPFVKGSPLSSKYHYHFQDEYGQVVSRKYQKEDTECLWFTGQYDPVSLQPNLEVQPLEWVDVSLPFQATMEFSRFIYNASSVGYQFKDVGSDKIFYVTSSTMESLIPLLDKGRISGAWLYQKTGSVWHVIPA